jgi:hypothetical protein
VSSLPISRFNDYYKAITQLEAENLMLLSKVAMLPNLKQKNINEWFKMLHGLLDSGKSRREMTLSQLAAKLSAGGNNGR